MDQVPKEKAAVKIYSIQSSKEKVLSRQTKRILKRKLKEMTKKEEKSMVLGVLTMWIEEKVAVAAGVAAGIDFFKK